MRVEDLSPGSIPALLEQFDFLFDLYDEVIDRLDDDIEAFYHNSALPFHVKQILRVRKKLGLIDRGSNESRVLRLLNKGKRQ